MTKTKKVKQKKISLILQNRQIEQMANQLELCHRRLETLENLNPPGVWKIAESNNYYLPPNFIFILTILIALIGAIVAACLGNNFAYLGLSIVAILTTALFLHFNN